MRACSRSASSISSTMASTWRLFAAVAMTK